MQELSLQELPPPLAQLREKIQREEYTVVSEVVNSYEHRGVKTTETCYLVTVTITFTDYVRVTANTRFSDKTISRGVMFNHVFYKALAYAHAFEDS